MEQCCTFIYKFKQITWTKAALTICLIPFVLLLLILIIILLCSVDTIGAVVTNSRVCAEIGRNLLESGGSAVDAAIGTMLCEGISLPYSVGIGGGFTAIMRVGGETHSIIATPTLPTAVSDIKSVNESYIAGARAAGIPAEIKGYWEMHQKYGLLSWKKIFQPSVDLCREGVPITEWFAAILRYYSQKIAANPSLSEIYPASEIENYQQDSKIKYPVLANTLQRIADNGVSEFYGGETGKALIEDIQKEGGILTLKDLKDYQTIWSEKLPYARILKKFKVISTPPPTSGSIIALLLNIVNFLNPEDDPAEFWKFIMEALKCSFESFGSGDPNDENYAANMEKIYEKMTSTDFAREVRNKIRDNISCDFKSVKQNVDTFFGRGSTNICISAPNGETVAITSSLMAPFGAFFRSNQTGIIVNSLLNHFVNKSSGELIRVGANKPVPKKHFVTGHCPSLVLDELDKPHFVIGASGGMKGATLTAVALIKYMMLRKSAREAINEQRSRHPYISNTIEHQFSEDDFILESFIYSDNEAFRFQSNFENISSATCIGHRNRMPDPEFTLRLGGSKSYARPEHELALILVALIIGLALSVIGLMLYEVLNPRRGSLS